MKINGCIFLLVVVAMLPGCKPSAPPAAAGAEHAQAEKSEEHGAEHAEISAAAAVAAGIKISETGPADIAQTLSAYGSIQPNAERVRNIVARFPGLVKTVVKAAGDSVAAGEVLATVESNDSLQTYAIKAPITGVVIQRNVNPGEAVNEQALFTVADLSSVWVELALFSRDLAQVKVGQNVQVRAVDGELHGDATIVGLSALGSAATQSVTARAVLNNAQRQWTPGLYVVGEIRLNMQRVPLAVLSAALQTLDGKTVVFIASGEDYTARAVEVGRSDGRFTEIRAGLQAGERYVSANSFTVKADIEKAGAGHAHE
jgi:cobalt-zinc-cadmium efflux system membrane fusion protein